MKKFKDTFLIVTAFVACPCHLPFVLPILATALAGTAVGAFIAENIFLLIVIASIYFVGVLAYIFRGSQR